MIQPEISRRRFAGFAGNSLTGTALASLLMREGDVLADAVPGQVRDIPHHVARAKRVVHLCLCGGVSHIDSFDYKPELERFHGKSLQADERPATFFTRSA